MSEKRFSDCSVSERLLHTSFIVILGVGYLFAMFLIFSTVSTKDGKPGLSVEDIIIKYHGNRSGTKLEAALTGGMNAYVSPEDHMVIISWIHNGARESGFRKKVEPILTARCVSCHNPDGFMARVNLRGYTNVMNFVKVDTGQSISALVRLSHIHLLGMAILFYLLGRIFLLAELPPLLKRIAIIVPFAAILLDIGSWWFTKYAYVFAYTVQGGGALMALSFAFQSFVSLYQMWFMKSKTKSI
ncbi:hypothetical protein MNBD_DELTA01-1457 [hydrothermal vent metagenome]|uniref:Elongation factor-1 alpha n=1 Tax=hydrothermal vent metagenome TaxID=652676 RepID=A0A3B0QSJ9_9ZZZZ